MELSRARENLAAAGIAAISRESIRQILHDAGINWLATTAWKASTDLDFIAKMRRVWIFMITRRPMGG